MEGIDVDGWSSGEFPSGEDNCISSVAGTESDKREKLVPIVDEKSSICTQEIVKVGGASGVDENGSICTREFVEFPPVVKQALVLAMLTQRWKSGKSWCKWWMKVFLFVLGKL